MEAHLDEAFEFDEADLELYTGGDGAREQRPGEDSEEEDSAAAPGWDRDEDAAAAEAADELDLEDLELEAEREPAPEEQGASAQSCTMRVSIDDDERPSPSPRLAVPASLGVNGLHGPRGAHGQRAQNHHHSNQYTRLGTSAPINIPAVGGWQGLTGDWPLGNGKGPAAHPSTFVPPHQLSQANDFMFSFSGASPSAAIKKERLRVRNSILRSTGFIEPQPHQAASAAAAAAAAIPVTRLLSSSQDRLPQSSLTQALNTIGEV